MIKLLRSASHQKRREIEATSEQQHAGQESERNDSRFYVPQDHFDRGMAVLLALRQSGALRVLTSRPRQPIQFEYEEDHSAVEEALRANDLSRANWRRALVDIGDVLTAAVGGVSTDRFAKVRADPERWADGEVEDPDTAQQKMQAVLKHFDVQDLKRRVWIKATSKTDIPHRLEWEVSIKHADAEAALPEGGPVAFATLRLAAESPDPYYYSETESHEVTITVDAEDVGYLITSLTRLQRALDRLKAESP